MDKYGYMTELKFYNIKIHSQLWFLQALHPRKGGFSEKYSIEFLFNQIFLLKCFSSS